MELLSIKGQSSTVRGIKMPINFVTTRPIDYHCDCDYCTKKYSGELKQPNGTYYSARARTGYSPKEKEIKHLCPGHWEGYAFVVEQFSQPGELVFDPCAGSGTALIEAIKIGRGGVGIELEFFEILKANCDLYPGSFHIVQGDARVELKNIFEQVDLIVTGTPYNNNSDAPERKNLATKQNLSFNYSDQSNLAFLKDKEYFDEIGKLYQECIKKLRVGGHFVIIIKDPIRKKAPYLLHKLITDRVLQDNKMEVTNVFIHKHYPPTLFISTYAKQYPGVRVPKYQTMVVMKKVGE